MKRIQLRCAEFQRLRIDGRGEKVDRIPDAPGLEDTVRTCQQQHRYPACQSAFQASRYRMRLQRQPCTDLIGRNGQTVNHEPVRDRHELAWNHGYFYFMLAREDL